MRQPEHVLRAMRRLLTPDEEDRAARYRFDRDRHAFECTRAALRTLAGRYSGLAPAEVRFSYGSKGKPGTTGISFNASSSGDVALAAFSSSGLVGVDVEAMRPDVSVRALARRFFSVPENEALEGLAEQDLVAGFYRCWTRKEAFVKALGEGLSFDLGRVEVSTGGSARVVSIDGDRAAAERWSMRDLAPRPGYAGVVAVDSPDAEVSLWDWPGLEVAAV